MDAAADDNSTFGRRTQRRDDERPDRGENQRRVQLVRRLLV